ncbi:hypothetical protein, partial [Paraburkholderia piptadeniae]|uniref:hypothetical protein n=1 Tax=Paraburkholderia piptadeniae TaxID=1701573 RepID=UPI001C458E4A
VLLAGAYGRGCLLKAGKAGQVAAVRRPWRVQFDIRLFINFSGAWKGVADFPSVSRWQCKTGPGIER